MWNWHTTRFLVATCAVALVLFVAKVAEPKDAKQRVQSAIKTAAKNNPSEPRSVNAEQPTPNTTADRGGSATYNYCGDFKYIPIKTPAAEGLWARNSALIAGLSTIFVAIFTGALVVTSCLQWRAINKQAEIAEATLTETSRPWVYPTLEIVSDGLRYDGVGNATLTE